jgi:hypothetical protein
LPGSVLESRRGQLFASAEIAMECNVEFDEKKWNQFDFVKATWKFENECEVKTDADIPMENCSSR